MTVPENPPRPAVTVLSKDRRTRLAVYLGLLAAYLAAAGGDPFAPFHLAFFATAAVWSLAFENRWRRFFFSPPVKIGLVLVGSALFAAALTGRPRGSPEGFAHSLSRFLFWNALVFVLSRNKSEYDLWTLAALELSLFLVSAAFFRPPDFLPLLLTALVCFLYAFQRSASLRFGDSNGSPAAGFGLTLWTTLLVLESAAVLFLIFPRRAFLAKVEPVRDRAPLAPAGSPTPSLPDRLGIPSSTEFMTLTHFERLKVDPRPVLRIRITGPQGRPVPPEQTLYLRGAILDTYTDGRWSARFDRQPRRDPDDGSLDGWTPLENHPPAGRTPVLQHIRVMPLGGDLSFCLPDPVRVRWREARYDPAGILFFPTPPKEFAEYDVESALMPMDVPRVPVPPAPSPRYLQLPPGLPRLRELARREEPREDRVHVKVAGFVRYLMRNGFTYKLGPFVPAGGLDPVEHFLEKREGYCVHYATALALLCRAAGIPARIATGFQLSDPQEDGTFLVKHSDAHAWVEIWFGPSFGWRAYDATPPESRPTDLPLPGEPVATTGKKEAPPGQGPPPRWDRFLSDLDPEWQGKAGRAILGGLSAAFRFLTSPWTMFTSVILGLLGAATYILLPGRHRRRLRQIATGFRESCTVDFYRDFLWILSRRGIRKPPGLTALEFASQIRLRVDAPAVDLITEMFQRTRYRGIPPSLEERRRLEESLARIEKTAPQPENRGDVKSMLFSS